MTNYEHEAEQLDAMREEIQQFRSALSSPAWTEVFLPWLTEAKVARANELVQACTTEKPDPLRIVGLGNRVATIEWVRVALTQKIQQFDLQQRLLAERIAQQEEEDEYHRQVVAEGHSNPYIHGAVPPEGYTGE